MITWIERLLLLFIFLIPWNARVILRMGVIGSPSTGSGNNFWEYGTVALYATDVLFILIAVLSSVWFIRQRKGATILNDEFQISNQIQNSNVSNIDSKFKIGNSKLLVLLVAGFICLSILWSPDKLVGFYAALKLCEGVVLFFLIRMLPINKEKLIWAFIASAIVQSVLAIVQFFAQSVFAWPFSGMAPQDPSHLGVSVVQFADERWLRAYGSFPHPNLFGAFLAIALLLALTKFRVHSKRLLITVYAVLFTGLFLTFSRAAWLAAALGIAYWVWSTRAWKERLIQQCAGLVGVFGIVLVALFFPLVQSRVTGIGRLELKSTSERMAGVWESFALIRANPLLGVGIGDYTAAVARDLRPGDPSWSYQPVHNTYLLVLAELGIIGVILFVLFFRQFTIHNSQFIIPMFLLLFLDHSFWTLHSGILLLWFVLAVRDVNKNAQLN